jgi:hypothetical protein
MRMRDGIYIAKYQVEQVTRTGVAVVQSDMLKGFDDRFFYYIGPREPPGYSEPKRRGNATRYGVQTLGASGSGFGIVIREVDDVEDWFAFFGTKAGEPGSQLSIQGRRIHDLP